MAAPVNPKLQSALDATAPPSVVSDTEETDSSGQGAPAAPAFGPPAQPGEVGALGPYRIVSELGRGGMGAVYAALDTRLERRLALKVMLPQFAANAAAKERFLREARAAAKISHDNVVTVYEADERDGVPYIAMQFLQGYPLDEYLKKKGNPAIAQIMRIAREAAAGLAAAHKLGLVHRDIKPANLWLEAPNGRIKVLDFGLAKPVDSEIEITKSGAVVGTPAYMSPEQARGEKVDHRTDLFSLGAVLYRLCTGRPPFHGPTTMAVLMALGTQEPTPVRDVNPNVPEPLAELIHQLLAKDPAARPPSAADVVKRVRGIAEGTVMGQSAAALLQPQPMLVPIPISAAPAANPFAELDATEAEPPPEPTIATAPVKRTPRRSPWVAVGWLAAFAAILIGSIIIYIKNKDGTVTKIEVPDGATVTLKDKDGKTLATVGPGLKVSPTDASADRKAAEWVLSLGGNVQVSVDGEIRGEIKAAADLPKGRFTLIVVVLNDNRGLTDTGLANLKDCKEVKSLHLSRTAVTDAGLVHLKGLSAMSGLWLEHTAVTDAGMAHLKGLSAMSGLFLGGTAVGDAGLAHLSGLTGMSQLGLEGTPVTDAGLDHLKGLKGLGILTLSGTKVSDEGLAHLKGLTVLRALYLAQTPVTDAGLVHLAGLKGLTILQLSQTKVTDAGMAHLKNLTGLKTLLLINTKVGNDGLAHLTALTGLTQLDLGDTPVTDAGLAHLKNMKGLTLLLLGSTPVTDAGLVHLAGLKGLSIFDLSNTKVTDAGLALFKDCKGLTELGVRKTKVTAKGAEEFHAAVPGCKIDHDGGTIPAIDVDRKAAEWVLSLGGKVRINGENNNIEAATALPKGPFTVTFVFLSGKGVTDEKLAAIPSCKGLKELNLVGTALTDAGLVHLKHFTGVTGLRITNTPINDAGLLPLTNLKGLTFLDLDGTAMTDAGLVHLKDLKELTLLSVQKTKVTPKGLADFHAAVPGCKIEHDGGTIPAIDPERKAAEYILSIGGTLLVNGEAREIKAAADLPKGRFALTGVGFNGNNAVTDAGLANCKDCKNLTVVDVRKTKVTAKGAEEFHAAVPGCTIYHDGGTIPAIDVDRKAAEWVLSIGGTVYVNGEGREIKPGTELPGGRLTLTRVNFSNNKAVTDAKLVALKDCKSLTSLNLDFTAVTDSGLANFKDCKNLMDIHVAYTQVSDSGLATFKDCKNMNLLDVRQSKVTTKGLDDFHAAVPGCEIIHDGGTLGPKK